MTGSDVGKRPELAWLPVAKCRVDHTYQRTLQSERSQRLIGRLVENFRWSAFQAILAMKDRGGFLILDGQHRVEAARRRKIEHVPAVVVASVSLEEQAAAFVQANRDRVAVTPYALHHANLVAGDPAAKAIDALCLKAGISIPRYPLPADKLKPGDTLALGTIAALPAKYGAAVAALALSAVADGHRRRQGQLRAPLFKAVAAILKETPEAVRAPRAKALVALLAKTDPGAIEDAAAKHRRERGGRHEAAIAAALLGLLSGSRDEALPRAGAAVRPAAPAQEIGPRVYDSPDPAPASGGPAPSEDAAEGNEAGAGAEPFWTGSVRNKLRALWPSERTTIAIAAEIGIGIAEVESQARYLRLGPRPEKAKATAPKVDDDKAIAEHLAKKGATRIEAALDVDAVMNECRRGGDAVVARSEAFDSFSINGGTLILDRRELLGHANRSRKKRGLPMWSPDQISWKRPPPPESEQQKRSRQSHRLVRSQVARLASMAETKAAKRGTA